MEPGSKSSDDDHISSQTSGELHSTALHSTSRYESDAKRKKINNKSEAVSSDYKDTTSQEKAVFLHGPERIVASDSEDARSISSETKPRTGVSKAKIGHSNATRTDAKHLSQEKTILRLISRVTTLHESLDVINKDAPKPTTPKTSSIAILRVTMGSPIF
ncbi:hypothetical protein BGZ80_005539 [Entomortierella chlamydospora]|uniref:Uncharacterized protein n=1 Tax=Entomortierella chlamydospora TaxID=101097 RepID=A0A9P6N0S1_9FUNG|nr:hypothetical protein BGZ80_005539 [Entomortierella chlamydospora]